MKKYIIKIKLLSDTLLGSGEGLGANIDLDIVLDKMGIPYIPARRIKGVLKDAVQDTIEMLKQANIEFTEIINSENIFGKPGQPESSKIFFSNLYLTEYNKSLNWFRYLKSEFKDSFSEDVFTDYFTSIRHQTQIDETGVTKEGSLRTFRVLNSGVEFEGTIEIEDEKEKIEIIALACNNLRNIGMMRNRGFGEVNVKLFDEDKNNLTEVAVNALEGLCTE